MREPGTYHTIDTSLRPEASDSKFSKGKTFMHELRPKFYFKFTFFLRKFNKFSMAGIFFPPNPRKKGVYYVERGRGGSADSR
jgi:hypothetical protein